MTYYVFYTDGYADAGGVGWMSFETEQAAMGFIAARLREAANPCIGDYRVVRGTYLPIVAVEVVTQVKVNNTAGA